MRNLTAAEFHKAIYDNLVWANMLTEPVEITDYCAPQFFFMHPNWPFGQSYGGSKNFLV